MAMGKKITWDHRYKDICGWYDCWFDEDGRELIIGRNFRALYKGAKIIVLLKWVAGQSGGLGCIGGMVPVPEYFFDETLVELEIKKGDFISIDIEGVLTKP